MLHQLCKVFFIWKKYVFKSNKLPFYLKLNQGFHRVPFSHLHHIYCWLSYNSTRKIVIYGDETASVTLQNQLNNLNNWLKLWRMKVDSLTWSSITFTLNKWRCPSVDMNAFLILRNYSVKYLYIYLENHLT